MILVAGGTGRLGTQLVGLLCQRGVEVRVLTRDRNRATHLVPNGVEIVEGDVQDLAAVRRAVEGAGTVVSAIHGFIGTTNASPATVDRDGNRNLVRAARDAEVEHVVLVSMHDASPDHPMSLLRMKYAAEQELKASGLPWTILRPTAFIETFCEVLGCPLVERGKTQVFGRGRNPINWVSVLDVARFVDLAIADPGLRGKTIEVCGPDNLSMTQFVDVFRAEANANGTVGHIPLVAMRLGALVMRLMDPGRARQIQAGIVMDTTTQAVDAWEPRRPYPSIPMTSVAEVVKRDFADIPPHGAISNREVRSP
jgi:NADH dehydrogenase